MKLIIVLFFLVLTGCSHRQNGQGKDGSNKPVFHLVNSNGKVKIDNSEFRKTRCGLYINHSGILAYKALDNSRKWDSTRNVDVYLTTIYNNGSQDDAKEMRSVVDTSSFQILGTFYFRDKNHIYDFSPMSDGGTISINPIADVESFTLLGNDFFARDKDHCFYRGRLIEGSDPNSFQLLDKAYSPFIAFDKSHFYRGEERLASSEVKELKLDSIRKRKSMLP